MPKQLNIPVQIKNTSVTDEVEIIESVQLLVKNLSLENLKLLAQKSKQIGINTKIQMYKNFM